jgi:phosphate uptake regulator
MSNDSECIEPCMAMLNAAKAIERIGDHTTNLSEEIYFAVTGEKLVMSKQS